MQRLSFTVADQDLIIALAGEIIMDMVLESKTELGRLVAGHEGRGVVLDLADVTFMDSSGVGLLIGLRRQCQDRGLDFRVTNPCPPIRKLFDTLRLTEFFAVPQPGAASPAP